MRGFFQWICCGCEEIRNSARISITATVMSVALVLVALVAGIGSYFYVSPLCYSVIHVVLGLWCALYLFFLFLPALTETDFEESNVILIFSAGFVIASTIGILALIGHLRFNFNEDAIQYYYVSDKAIGDAGPKNSSIRVGTDEKNRDVYFVKIGTAPVIKFTLDDCNELLSYTRKVTQFDAIVRSEIHPLMSEAEPLSFNTIGIQKATIFRITKSVGALRVASSDGVLMLRVTYVFSEKPTHFSRDDIQRLVAEGKIERKGDEYVYRVAPQQQWSSRVDLSFHTKKSELSVSISDINGFIAFLESLNDPNSIISVSRNAYYKALDKVIELESKQNDLLKKLGQ